jgi:hypothetical protein
MEQENSLKNSQAKEVLLTGASRKYNQQLTSAELYKIIVSMWETFF